MQGLVSSVAGALKPGALGPDLLGPDLLGPDLLDSSGTTAGYHSSDNVSCTRYTAVQEAAIPGSSPRTSAPCPLTPAPCALPPKEFPLPVPDSPEDMSGEIADLRSALGLTKANLPLCHMEYKEGPGGGWNWQESAPLPSPLLPVCLSVHVPSYSLLGLPLPKLVVGRGPRAVDEQGVADTGAQMDLISAVTARALGLDTATLLEVRARVFGASRGAEIQLLGGVLLEVRPPGSTQREGPTTVRLFYVASNVSRTYLSLSTLKTLGVVNVDFPKFRLPYSVAASEQRKAEVPSCTNTGVVTPGQPACSCPRRTLPPDSPAKLPCPATEANLPQLKQFLLDRYASSSFNVCEHQPLPMLKGSPPLKLHVDPAAQPRAVHTPAVVPLHWQEAVKAGLDRDVRLGVLERVPLNTPVKWQSRMVVTAKQNGDPRRCVDYQAVNDCSPRQTHHTATPWHLVTSIPERVKKSVFDCWHGYHSLELATEEDRAATSFVTCWGRYRYRTCPQGFISAGDGYTDRLDRLLEELERQRRCTDDTLLYDDTIEQQFHRACRFLDICGQNGVLLNPKKFQFAQDAVEYLGFKVTATGVEPTSSYTQGILNFPTPSNITDIRSWFGAVAQVSYAFASSPVMAPFKHLLSSKVPFSWSPDLEAAFQASKLEVVRQCEEGVRTFDPSLPTALATDWSKTGMGYWLTQKRCECPGNKPGCCNSGWQTVSVGSRFCSGAEQRYSPICGEATASAFGVQKCKYFLLGMPNFQLCFDHRPLLKIFSPSMDLGEIPNPRLYNQKVKLLPYRFTPVYIPGKLNVVPDSYSRRGDSPVTSQPSTTDVDLLDIDNVTPGYSNTLGPPSWVAGPSGCSKMGLLASLCDHPCSLPTAEEVEDADQVEELLAGVAKASLNSLDTEYEAAAVKQKTVCVLTWLRLQQGVAESPQCQALVELMAPGLPEDKQLWPESLHPYYTYRHHLVYTDGVILCGERPLIPTSLRLEVLEHLHGAHHCVTNMLARATQAVFWPGMKADVTAHRANCRSCTVRAPSNPAPPPTEPEQPDFPFSHIVADFFQVDATYLAVADRYSNWLSVFKLKKDDSAHMVEAFRRYFSRWGVAKEMTSDGASVFTSAQFKEFTHNWGVKQRIASAYYPRANKRAEVAVKSAKRLVQENLGPGGSLDTDAFARALLAHRNCPDTETGLSPAQILFGRQLRDHIPALVSRYQPRQEWRLEADLRERALAKRHGRMEDRLLHGSRALPPLSLGDVVAVQDLQTEKSKPGRWTKSGEVVEVLPHDAYLIKMHGSRGITKRNRRFLRKITPFSPIIPVTSRELQTTQVVTRARAKQEDTAAPQPIPVDTPPHAQPASNPEPRTEQPAAHHDPTPEARTCQPGGHTAAQYRQQPAARPGEDVITLLKQREAQGHHLSLELYSLYY